jgi:hypothetical protein
MKPSRKISLPLKTAQRFSAGFSSGGKDKSRQGRKNTSAVPSGLALREIVKPGAEALGYFHKTPAP